MDITIRQGETLQIPIVDDDTSAVSVQFQVVQDGVIYIDETENFVIVDNQAQATIETNDTNLDTGVYHYMFTVTYSDGVVKKLPSPDEGCNGDCELPDFIVCAGDLLEVS